MRTLSLIGTSHEYNVYYVLRFVPVHVIICTRTVQLYICVLEKIPKCIVRRLFTSVNFATYFDPMLYPGLIFDL